VPSERDRNQEGMSLTKSTWNFIAHSALCTGVYSPIEKWTYQSITKRNVYQISVSHAPVCNVVAYIRVYTFDGAIQSHIAVN